MAKIVTKLGKPISGSAPFRPSGNRPNASARQAQSQIKKPQAPFSKGGALRNLPPSANSGHGYGQGVTVQGRSGKAAHNISPVFSQAEINKHSGYGKSSAPKFKTNNDIFGEGYAHFKRRG